MTLPTNIDLPLITDVAHGSPEDLQKYMKTLIGRLEDMYQDVAQNVNGSIREWIPQVQGTTSAGTATYSVQSGWLRRSGIITELWFTVAWSGHTGTGPIVIKLPYQSAVSEGNWVGVLEAGDLTFNAGFTYVVLSIDSNSNEGNVIQCGSGMGLTFLNVQASGFLSGYIQYIGKEFEN